MQDRLNVIYQTFRRDSERLQTPPSPSLLKQAKAARRFKVENKTRERLREERGEVLNATIRRARKRPPPHVLAQMTEEQKRLDAVARSSVSEVGYVGYVKRKLGWKLRNPDAWKVEEGKPENQAALDELDHTIHEENTRRRMKAEAGVLGDGQTLSTENQ